MVCITPKLDFSVETGNSPLSTQSAFVPLHFSNVELHYLSLIDTPHVTISMPSLKRTMPTAIAAIAVSVHGNLGAPSGATSVARNQGAPAAACPLLLK